MAKHSARNRPCRSAAVLIPVFVFVTGNAPQTARAGETAPPAGTVIDAGNVAAHAAVIDENLAALVADGLLQIKVRDPYTIPPHPAYQAATTPIGTPTITAKVIVESVSARVGSTR